MSEPAICEPGGGGTFFPLSDAEHGWPDSVRAVIYSVLLMYVFYGVSIVADIFMNSIEHITSELHRVKNKKTGRVVTLSRWNKTVSNLTLMALGSSAPEILLSIMEMINNEFYSGELGPSTIVGSAAFNLFCIIGLCIVSIPSSEKPRAIESYNVFIVTALFSIFAYLWLVIIVQVITPDVIEPWEAVVTLMFFPLLLIISYLVDIGWFDRIGPKAKSTEDIESPLQKQWDEQSVEAMQPVTDKQGKVIRNAPGVFSYSDETMRHVPIGDEDSPLTVKVFRCNGTRGLVSCRYKTRPLSAVPEQDYCGTSGRLTFSEGDSEREIHIKVKPKRRWKRSDTFQIVLSDAQGGAIFNPNQDGGDDSCVATVTIVHLTESEMREDPRRCGEMMANKCDYCFNCDAMVPAIVAWKEQVMNALFNVSSGDDDDEEEDDDGGKKNIEESRRLSGIAILRHLVSLPWKFMFAVLIPPVELSGGWACFCMALVLIGGVTSLIIDLAELFGCVCGLEDSIVAITFVALGTSMPDLFASYGEAVKSPDADASIVNVTGSNSVNVFLGIGIPWTMAALYWMVADPTAKWLSMYATFRHKYPDGAFIVLGGDLGFSVLVFTIAAVIALFVLWLRRKFIGGELGGPVGMKAFSGFLFFMLWIFYIILSIWKTKSPNAAGGEQVLVVLLSLCAFENILLVVGLCLAVLVYKYLVKPTDGHEVGREVTLPALKDRGMQMDDLKHALQYVTNLDELKMAVLNPEAFIQKLTTVGNNDDLAAAARAFAIAQLRPLLEADLFKLHGIGWKDFLPVLEQVETVEVLRYATMNPADFLESLECKQAGMNAGMKKAFLTAKLVNVVRPLTSSIMQESEMQTVVEEYCRHAPFEEVRKEIEAPSNIRRCLGLDSAEKGCLAGGSVKGASDDFVQHKICAFLQLRPRLWPLFEERGLPWKDAVKTYRKISEDMEGSKEISKLMPPDGASDESLRKLAELVCEWAKEDALQHLVEVCRDCCGERGWDLEWVADVFKSLDLQKLMQISEQLSGEDTNAQWEHVVTAARDGYKQFCIAQIKSRSDKPRWASHSWAAAVAQMR